MTEPNRYADPHVFWDDVHIQRDARWVADHSAEEQKAILDLAGPFSERFAAAKSVLDVGPGFARLLKSDPSKDRWAMEVSAVHRRRLEESSGIDAYSPYWNELDCPQDEVNLAWSISCFPHCDLPMQGVLLRKVYVALRPGGMFFLEHVEDIEGAPPCPDKDKMAAGRYAVSPEIFRDAAPFFGLRMLAAKRRDIGSTVVRGWVTMFEKPDRP